MWEDLRRWRILEVVTCEVSRHQAVLCQSVSQSHSAADGLLHGPLLAAQPLGCVENPWVQRMHRFIRMYDSHTEYLTDGLLLCGRQRIWHENQIRAEFAAGTDKLREVSCFLRDVSAPAP